MRRTKLTLAEKKKRQERNERRGRKSERKSEPESKNPLTGGRVANPMAGGRAMRLRDLNASRASRERSVLGTVDHASKWKNSPPCDCNRCVERRALEAEAEKAVNAGRHRLKKEAA